jgi:outer membrane protein insertion porin family
MDISLLVREDASRLLELSGLLSGPSASAVVDFRDSPFDATRGWFHSSSLQFGVRTLGSDLGYVRYLARQFYYQPVGPITLAAGARWGTLTGFGGVAPVNILDYLFTAGGTTTVRGYAEASLSAVDFFGVNLGGTDVVILNGEVRFPIVKWFKGVVFVDAGNTFIDRSQIALNDLAVGTGFGLRIRTPLAPIRIDLGFPTPRRPGDPRFRWHFSIGQMF